MLSTPEPLLSPRRNVAITTNEVELWKAHGNDIVVIPLPVIEVLYPQAIL